MASSACVDSQYFDVSPEGYLTLKPGAAGLRQRLLFKKPGTSQFRKADYPWLARVRVQVQAGGGGSAGAKADKGQTVCRPGGAGGGYSESVIEAADLGDVETVVVGAGGEGGEPDDAGGAGGNSSFGGLVSANGGAGSEAAMESGTSVACYSGVPGPLPGTGQFVAGGGAGGGCFRLSGFEGQSGEGGESILGHGGAQRSSPGNGPSRGRGGGGGGAFARDGSSSAGASGYDGIVIVDLYA